MAAASQGSEQARSFSSPQEETLLQLMRSADCLHRAMQQRLKPFGITANQYNVLRILRGAPSGGLTCSAIGRSMITPEPDITRLLARLKAQKLLDQQRDDKDRRVVWTHISALGLEILAKLDGVVEQAPRELLQALTGAELKELTRLLKKARCCGRDEILPAAELSATDLSPADLAATGGPHLRRSTLLPHRPE